VTGQAIKTGGVHLLIKNHSKLITVILFEGSYYRTTH